MTPKTITYVGLGVSVGLVAIIAITLFAINAHHDSIGDPTDATAAPVLKKINLNLDLGKFTTPPSEDGTTAAPVYVAAFKEAAAIENFPDLVTRTAEPEKNPELKSILDKIEDAADKPLGQADLDFEDIMPITPGAEWHSYDILYGIGKITAKAGTSMRSDNHREGSEKALRAGIIFGQRLYKNGVYIAYKSAGISCVAETLATYERAYSPAFYNDETKLAAVKDAKAGLQLTATAWNSKEKLFHTVKPVTGPGDLWNIIEHDEDRAWKLDAVMWLGVSKLTEVSPGAQRTAIQKYLEQKAESSDPYLAKRARAAAKFSKADIDGFREE